jgi:hypothetical protein
MVTIIRLHPNRDRHDGKLTPEIIGAVEAVVHMPVLLVFTIRDSKQQLIGCPSLINLH